MLTMMRQLPFAAVYTQMASPIGNLMLIASSEGLHALLDDKDCEEDECLQILSSLTRSNDHNILLETKKQLSEYFSGNRTRFDLPLAMTGTPFQIRAWQELTKIPYGKTISYGEQATRMGDKRWARAVGGANARNPLGVIVPCHRVIGHSGKLTGFRGGVNKKQYLLDLESRA